MKMLDGKTSLKVNPGKAALFSGMFEQLMFENAAPVARKPRKKPAQEKPPQPEPPKDPGIIPLVPHGPCRP